MAIPEHVTKNFETLKRAFENGDVALMECTVKGTGEHVDVICAMEWVHDEAIFTPFALMPPRDKTLYELVDPPGEPECAGSQSSH